MYKIPGHHHISMITKNASQNNHFYRHVLGLRRVKVTVNQDDPSMYHLFYGDKTGSPGTELSFFEIPLVGKTYRGTNAITKIGLLVPSEESLHYWKARFEEHGVTMSEITTYANHPALHFEDSEGFTYGTSCLKRCESRALAKLGKNPRFPQNIKFKEWVLWK